MLQSQSNQSPFDISRRSLLRGGALGLLGSTAFPEWTLASPSTVSADRNRFGRARSCILVYLLGGPPHQDMWDLKPDAPAEVRGPFRPIATNVPGIRIGEHLPRLSRHAHQMALVRSVCYPNHDHPFMIYYTLTGRVSPVPLGENTVLPPSRNDFPHTGSVLARFKHGNPHVPGYVAIPEVRVRMAAIPVSGGGRAGFLGPRYDPFPINDDPGQLVPELRLAQNVTPQRQADRHALLAHLEGCAPRSRATQEHGAFRESAARLLGSSAARDLFLIEREPDSLKDRYGQHRFGRSLLLARRLVEGGVSMVGVHFNYMSRCDGWDTHSRNFECLQNELLPLVDQGVSALLDDLAQRGLLHETLVVVMGEFGRTPRINGNAGRDHWGHCASVVLAGGGVQGGRVVGASDRIAAYVRESPVDPADIQATIYHCLGLDPHHEMHDALQRPLPISQGRVVTALF